MDNCQNPSDSAGFICELAAFLLAKHIAPNWHVAGAMPFHFLATIYDPIYLPEGELALVLFAQLRQIRGPHRQQVECRYHTLAFSSEPMADGTMAAKLTLPCCDYFFLLCQRSVWDYPQQDRP